MAKFPSSIMFDIDQANVPQAWIDDPESTKKELYKAKLVAYDAKDGSILTDDAGNEFSFETWLDETFQIAVNTSWDNPFSGSLVEQIAGGGKFAQFAGGIEKMAGITTQLKKSTGCVWSNSGPISISLPFHFKAYNSAYDDVVVPARNLMQLCAPGESYGMLTPPGPLLAEQAGITGAVNAAANATIGKDLFSGGEILKLKIGKFLTFPLVVINSVTHEIKSLFDEYGYPLGMTVNVECQTFYVATRPDIGEIFGAKRDG